MLLIIGEANENVGYWYFGRCQNYDFQDYWIVGAHRASYRVL